MGNEILSDSDKIDQKIVEILSNNARTPSKEIASELRKLGHEVSDRTIRKRIERLEKSGLIKGYKAILSDVLQSNQCEGLLLRFKPSKSLNLTQNSLKEVVSKFPNYLFVANMEGDWNMFVAFNIDDSGQDFASKIIEKFSDQISEYKKYNFKITDMNILNMSLFFFQ
ncbi:MAG: Lrp/AsnC family transcriptional regulator [Nitrososphaerota archaeon]